MFRLNVLLINLIKCEAIASFIPVTSSKSKLYPVIISSHLDRIICIPHPCVWERQIQKIKYRWVRIIHKNLAIFKHFSFKISVRSWNGRLLITVHSLVCCDLDKFFFGRRPCNCLLPLPIVDPCGKDNAIVKLAE